MDDQTAFVGTTVIKVAAMANSVFAILVVVAGGVPKVSQERMEAGDYSWPPCQTESWLT
jgi:hypothetical protein